MPAVTDNDLIYRCHSRLDVVVSRCDIGEIGENIRHCDCRCDLLDGFRPFGYLLANLTEKIIFQRLYPIFRVQDLCLLLLEFGCNEPFRIPKRLFTDIVVRHIMQVRFRYINVIAEDLIESNLQGLDTAPFAFFFLHRGDPLFALSYNLPEFVQFLAITVADHTAFSDCCGWVGMDTAFNQFDQLWKRIQGVVKRHQ